MDNSDFYDYKKVQDLQNKRARKWIKLYYKAKEARDKGDEEATKKTLEALVKHENRDRKLREQAERIGGVWM